MIFPTLKRRNPSTSRLTFVLPGKRSDGRAGAQGDCATINGVILRSPDVSGRRRIPQFILCRGRSATCPAISQTGLCANTGGLVNHPLHIPSEREFRLSPEVSGGWLSIRSKSTQEPADRCPAGAGLRMTYKDSQGVYRAVARLSP